MVRLPGVAPGRSPWQGDILLLNHNREIGESFQIVFTLTPIVSFAPGFSPVMDERRRPSRFNSFFLPSESRLSG
jgi:hypothetical protein